MHTTLSAVQLTTAFEHKKRSVQKTRKKGPMSRTLIYHQQSTEPLADFMSFLRCYRSLHAVAAAGPDSPSSIATS